MSMQPHNSRVARRQGHPLGSAQPYPRIRQGGNPAWPEVAARSCVPSPGGRQAETTNRSPYSPGPPNQEALAVAATVRARNDTPIHRAVVMHGSGPPVTSATEDPT